MALLADDSDEAASFHACRAAAHEQQLDPGRLAQAGAYAGALAWGGHVAKRGKPGTVDRARDLVTDAAYAFIGETAKERHIDPDGVRAAKQQASHRLDELVRAEYA